MKKKIFIVIVTLLLVTVVPKGSYFNTEAVDGTYNVHVLSFNKTTGSIDKSATHLTTNDYAVAYKKMNELSKTSKDVIITSTESRSATKIVAASRGYAQSYPYRIGKKGDKTAKNTLTIFVNTALTSSYSYIGGHYVMYVHDFSKVNEHVLEVEYQGVRGYVDITKTDIIPTIYIENKVEIVTGGTVAGEYFTTPEKQMTSVPVVDTYKSVVDTNNPYGNTLQITYDRVDPNLRDGTTSYAVAPTFMKTNVDYYSLDGIQFYEDIDYKKPIGDKFYSYFQWLPARSLSNHTSVDFNKFLKSLGYHDTKSASKYSVMFNSEHSFIEYGQHYGFNPLLVFAQASLESAYGSSDIAKNKYNLFGWGAVDSNPGNATSYEGVELAVKKHYMSQFPIFFNSENWRNYGTGFGNKGSGAATKYASDPHYGIKVAGIAYQMDRMFGYKDYNAYNLFALSDGKKHIYEKKASTAGGNFYASKHNKNQIITDLGTVNGFIKTNLSMSVANGNAVIADVPTNLTQVFGYVASSGSAVKKYGPTKNKVPTSITTVSPKVEKMVVTAESGLNMRTGWSTENNVILTMPKGAKVNAQLVSNGWAKVKYLNYTGFVSAEFLSMENGTTPEEPFLLGDVDANGKITSRDYMWIKEYIMGARKLTPDQLKRADIAKPKDDPGVTSLDYMTIKNIIMER